MSRTLSILKGCQAALSAAGRRGPSLLLCGLAAGLAWPDLAAAARPWMPAAVFLVNLGGFLQVDRAGMSGQFASRRRLLLVLGWTLLGVPLAAWAVLQALPVSAPVQAAIVLYALAPPAASAVALSGMLGLNMQLALIGRGIGCLLAPLTLPLLGAWLLGPTLRLDAWAMAQTLSIVVLGAALGAAALRRVGWPGGDRPQRARRSAGVAVVGLVVLGMGAMDGMQARWLHDGAAMATTLAAATAVAAGLQWLGSVAFAALGRVDAMTIGMTSGQRNVSLVWVALVPPPGGDSVISAFFAAWMLVCFACPAVMHGVLSWPVRAVAEPDPPLSRKESNM